MTHKFPLTWTTFCGKSDCCLGWPWLHLFLHYNDACLTGCWQVEGDQQRGRVSQEPGSCTCAGLMAACQSLAPGAASGFWIGPKLLSELPMSFQDSLDNEIQWWSTNPYESTLQWCVGICVSVCLFSQVNVHPCSWRSNICSCGESSLNRWPKVNMP